MHRKRKTKYIWLPTLGADPVAGDITETNSFSFSCTASSANVNSVASIALFPLLEDTPQEPATTGNPDPNIADFIGTDYVCKRIVGKIFIASGFASSDTYFAVKVTAGFFVARADDQNPLLPVGASTTALAIENYDPDYVDNIRSPWMWRRSWILSNNLSTNASAVAKLVSLNFPNTNCSYGSVQDGPHIDVKSVRRIRRDERLFFACTARGWSPTDTNYSSQPANDTTVSGLLDIRVLGALRRARNRSAF